MKISSINNTPSFNRVVQIRYDVSNGALSSNKGLGALEAVLNSECKSKLYTPDEESNIRHAFCDMLEDYNGVYGVTIKKFAGGGTYILSGDDYSKYKTALKRLNELKNEPVRVSNIEGRKNYIALKERKLEGKIISASENGRDGKRDSFIKLSFLPAKRGAQKLKEVEYQSYHTTYSAIKDGAVDLESETNIKEGSVCHKNVECAILNYII